MNTNVDEARELLENSASSAIITHARPDGDAVSSMLALYLSLRERGKSVSAVLHDPLPSRFKSLPGADRIKAHLRGDEHLLIAVDCAVPDRISLAEGERSTQIDINIDHHPTNSLFGRVNFVFPKAASTTQVLYDLMPSFNLPIMLTSLRT